MWFAISFIKEGIKISLNGKNLVTKNTLNNPIVKTKSSNNDNVTNNIQENSVPVPNPPIRPRKQPGIYMIQCISNNFRYFGESSNVSNRISSQKSTLSKNKNPLDSLQIDYNKYGPENFKFIILFMGDEWSNLKKRTDKESELINSYKPNYNRINSTSRLGKKNPYWNKSESKKKRQQKASENKPGIYYILCLENRFIYYGETALLRTRIEKHKDELRKKIHVNQNLQQDFNKFGEEKFEFSTLFIGEFWKDPDTRLAKEAELIKTAQVSNKSYNLYATLKEKIVTQKTKDKTSAALKGIPNKILGRKVETYGKVFDSVAEAARYYKVDPGTIRYKIKKDPKNYKYVD